MHESTPETRLLARYEALARFCPEPRAIEREARHDGLDPIARVHLLKHLFALGYPEARRLVFGPTNASEAARRRRGADLLKGFDAIWERLNDD